MSIDIQDSEALDDIKDVIERGDHRRQKDEAARTLCRRDTDRSKRTKATVFDGETTFCGGRSMHARKGQKVIII
uniref:DUF2191 domain-containing protein n=1 Tax=Globodera pallida TaxID=36090 RepID=A0A183BQ26_GLOPA